MTSILDLIGRDAARRSHAFDRGPCRLFLKLESPNPGGSIKDRIGSRHDRGGGGGGRLKPGGTIVEATAGNTGLGLALVGVLQGLPHLLVVPDKMAREKIQHLRALGAEVRITRSDVGKGHPEYYQDMAERIAASTGRAFTSTSSPIRPIRWRMRRRPARKSGSRWSTTCDAVVLGVGSGGTLTGIGPLLASVSAETRDGAGRPVGSILAPSCETGKMVEAGTWMVEGIGEDFIPANADMSLVARRLFHLRSRELCETARALLAKEGILAGSSSRHAAGGGAALLPRADRAASASSRLSATAATNISPRSTTTSG